MTGTTPSTVDLATLARLRDAMLRRAARDRDSLFGEVARDVLAGRTTLRDAATGGAYAEAFAMAGAQLAQSLRDLPREEVTPADAATGLANLADRLEREEREATATATADDDAASAERTVATRRPTDGDDEDDEPFSVLREAPRNDYGQNPRRATWQRRG